VKKVNYVVSGPFGNSKEGEVIEAFLIVKDPDTNNGLLYHPASGRGDCASVSICAKVKTEGGIDYYKDISPDLYVNINREAGLAVQKVFRFFGGC